MRNYTHFDSFVTAVTQDVYPQPADPGHTAWGLSAIRRMLGVIGAPNTEGKNVLDLGCGQAPFAQEFEGEPWKMNWRGVTIGEDFSAANHVMPGKVFHEDMSFLPFADGLFDIVFSRHSLEHSPFPLITLMEWRRVCKSWLVLVLPGYEYYGPKGKNHYSVLPKLHWMWLLERAGWKVVWSEDWTNDDPLFLEHQKYAPPIPGQIVEYRFLCERHAEVLE